MYNKKQKYNIKYCTHKTYHIFVYSKEKIDKKFTI